MWTSVFMDKGKSITKIIKKEDIEVMKTTYLIDNDIDSYIELTQSSLGPWESSAPF